VSGAFVLLLISIMIDDDGHLPGPANVFVRGRHGPAVHVPVNLAKLWEFARCPLDGRQDGLAPHGVMEVVRARTGRESDCPPVGSVQPCMPSGEGVGLHLPVLPGILE